MSGVTDIVMVLFVLGGIYILMKSGKLEEILGGNFQLPTLPPLPGLSAPAPAPPVSQIQPPPTRGGTKTVPAPSGSVTGDKIYPDASPPHICTNVSDGGIEQDGDRKEPQIACNFPFLNTEATVYINYHGINDTLSIKLRGPKHSGIPEGDMCNNIHYVGLGGAKPAFGKQAGHTAEYCEFGNSISIPESQWVGVKAIEWNEGSSVHFQTWLQVPEGSTWKLAADFVDNGGSTGCGGDDPRAGVPYTKSPCSTGQVSIGYRVDGLKAGGDVQFKGLSVREIVGGKATGGGGGGVVLPGGTTGRGEIGGGSKTAAPAPTTTKPAGVRGQIGSNYAVYSPRRLS